MSPRAVARPGPRRCQMGILRQVHASLVLACFCESFFFPPGSHVLRRVEHPPLVHVVVDGSLSVFSPFSRLLGTHARTRRRRRPRTLRSRCILHTTSSPDSLSTRGSPTSRRHCPRPRRRRGISPRARDMHVSAPYTLACPSPTLDRILVLRSRRRRPHADTHAQQQQQHAAPMRRMHRHRHRIPARSRPGRKGCLWSSSWNRPTGACSRRRSSPR